MTDATYITPTWHSPGRICPWCLAVRGVLLLSTAGLLGLVWAGSVWFF